MDDTELTALAISEGVDPFDPIAIEDFIYGYVAARENHMARFVRRMLNNCIQ